MTGQQLKQLLDQRGIKQKWFAENIMMIQESWLSTLINQDLEIPEKYLTNINKHLG